MTYLGIEAELDDSPKQLGDVVRREGQAIQANFDMQHSRAAHRQAICRGRARRRAFGFLLVRIEGVSRARSTAVAPLLVPCLHV